MAKVVSFFLSVFLFIINKSVESKPQQQQQPPVATTSYGQIIGIQDTNATMFLGIPFAQPPVDNLRWHEPIDPKPWKPEILDAKEFKPSCPQPACSPAAACPPIVLY